MDIFRLIAERRIVEAVSRGEFDDLPGAGKPLVFDDEPGVPCELRLSYKILKNSGCIPPELQLRKDVIALKDLITTLDDDGEKAARIKELNYKLIRYNILAKRPLNLDDPAYEEKVVERLTGTGRDRKEQK